MISGPECLHSAQMNLYILRFLWRVYENQRASVHIDGNTITDFFNIVCPLRHGDPLPPLLLNSATRVILDGLRQEWLCEGCGTEIGSDIGHRITHAMPAG